ncbi:MAG: hypothetical protein ACT4NP_06810 [Pseudonocardiales bacterium]
MSTLLDAPRVPVGFVDDPIASHSAQFGLARPIGTPVGHDAPSPVGIRPWNLRGVQVMDRCGARVGVWRYDHDRQLAFTRDGHLVTEIIAADPSADSVTDLDGDEGKSEDWEYEDWEYDFWPDTPGIPA